MSGVKATAKKAKITLKWKKAAGVSGYQVQISDQKSLKNAKTLTCKADKTSVVLKKANGKKLKKKKTYYIRIRTYKTVKASDGTKKTIYGKYKTVRVKIK